MGKYHIRITELAEQDLENAIYIVRILHMLVDSKAWLYRVFGL